MRRLKGSSKTSPAITSSCAPSDRGTQVQVIIFQRRELIYSNRDRPQEKRGVYRKLYPGLSD
jgi:hypothetical protein